jgi:hypothetical protein
MVLAMVEFKRFLAHAARGKSIGGEGKGWQFESHGQLRIKCRA